MHDAAAGLGRGGIEQVGADGGRRVNAEQENQERGHQRAAAHACHSDKQADAESRSDIKGIDHVHTICSDICGYLMAQRTGPQRTVANKNVSCAHGAWTEILHPSHACGGIAVLRDLRKK